MRSITKPMPLTAEALYEKLMTFAKKHNLKFNGSPEGGEANYHGFKLSYQVRGEELEVIVHDKPRLVPWFIVEQKLDDLF